MPVKPYVSIALALFLLGACQSQSVLPSAQPPVSPQQLNPLQAFNQQNNTALLRISAALQAELQQPDTEVEPRQDSFDEALARRVLEGQYVQAHSYYFQTLDNQNSTIEAILKHDGYLQAAATVTHWRNLLGQNAVWPDRTSTTYNGPWPALEHGQMANGKGWFGLRSASVKAEEYYQRALDTWQRHLPPDHPEQAESWSWLGRSTHFLQDMSVPFHTMSLVRPAQLIYHQSYEKSCDEFFVRYLPSRNHNPQGVWEGGGPYPATGQWGHYYPPGTRASQIVTQMADTARPFYKLVNRRDNDERWEKTRAVMVPLGAKTTAGMIVNFLREVGVQP